MNSICFGCDIFQPSKNFPRITAITIVLRTLRRCLEKLGNKIEKIVLCVNDLEIYEKLYENMKIFFPRSEDEEKFMERFIPDVKETEYGDIIIPERNIKIVSNFKQKNENPKKNYENIVDEKSNFIHNYELYKNLNLVIETMTRECLTRYVKIQIL